MAGSCVVERGGGDGRWICYVDRAADTALGETVHWTLERRVGDASTAAMLTTTEGDARFLTADSVRAAVDTLTRHSDAWRA